MPYAPTLPTTGLLSFPQFLSSSTHPSLPVAATVERNNVRASLKRHKRLPASSRAAHLAEVLKAINAYLPYLLALDCGLCSQSIPTGSFGSEEIVVVLRKEVECEWRSTLSATLPRVERSRVKMRGLDSEILFALATLANVHFLLARERLRPLVDSSAAALPSEQERKVAAATAVQHLLDAHAVLTYAASVSEQNAKSAGPPEIDASILIALAAMALGEATLAFMVKDDGFAAAAAQDRHKHDKEWMFKAPEMPKARAAVFTRICVAASDHARRGSASLSAYSGPKLSEHLSTYLEDLWRAARAKACRFQGIEAEAQGETGRGIAWLYCAREELGLNNNDSSGTRSSLSKLKKGWTERREDKRVERGGGWGSDAGRAEEERVVDMLLRKWERENDTINIQRVPATSEVLPSMPSGRDPLTAQAYKPAFLDESALRTMRGPPDPEEERMLARDDEGDSENEEARGSGIGVIDPVGAFPGTADEYDSTAQKSSKGYY